MAGESLRGGEPLWAIGLYLTNPTTICDILPLHWLPRVAKIKRYQTLGVPYAAWLLSLTCNSIEGHRNSATFIVQHVAMAMAKRTSKRRCRQDLAQAGRRFIPAPFKVHSCNRGSRPIVKQQWATLISSGSSRIVVFTDKCRLNTIKDHKLYTTLMTN